MDNKSDHICSEFAEKGAFIAYLESELSPDDETRFIQHLRECENCARHLELITRGHEQLVDAPESLHPSGDEIFNFALGKEQDPYVAGHVERCKSCAHELEALREHVLAHYPESTKQPAEKLYNAFYGSLLELLNIPGYIVQQLKKAPALSLGAAFAAIIVTIMLYPWQSYMRALPEQGFNYNKTAPQTIKDTNETLSEDKEPEEPLTEVDSEVSEEIAPLENTVQKKQLTDDLANRPKPTGKMNEQRAKFQADEGAHSSRLRNDRPPLSVDAPGPARTPLSSGADRKNEANGFKTRQEFRVPPQSGKPALRYSGSPSQGLGVDEPEPESKAKGQLSTRGQAAPEPLKSSSLGDSWSQDKETRKMAFSQSHDPIPIAVELLGPSGPLPEKLVLVPYGDFKSKYKLIVRRGHDHIGYSRIPEKEEVDGVARRSGRAGLEKALNIVIQINRNKDGYQALGKLTANGSELAVVERYGIGADDLNVGINKVLGDLLTNFERSRKKPAKNPPSTSDP